MKQIKLLIAYCISFFAGSILFGVIRRVYMTQATAIQMSTSGYLLYNVPLKIVDYAQVAYSIGIGVLFGILFYYSTKEKSNEEE